MIIRFILACAAAVIGGWVAGWAIIKIASLLVLT